MNIDGEMNVGIYPRLLHPGLKGEGIMKGGNHQLQIPTTKKDTKYFCQQ